MIRLLFLVLLSGCIIPKTLPFHEVDISELGAREAGLGLAEGTTIPDGTLKDIDGNTVELYDQLGKHWSMIVFYRGGWCPYCNYQLRELSFAKAEFRSRNIRPVFISVDQPTGSEKTRASWHIPYPVLSDSEAAIHRQYNIIHKATDKEVKRLKGFGIDIEAASGLAHHEFAIPSIFIVDENHRLRWSHVDIDYKVRPTVEQLLSVIDSLK